MTLSELYGCLYANVKEVYVKYNGFKYCVNRNGFHVNNSFPGSIVSLQSSIVMELDGCIEHKEGATEYELLNLLSVYFTTYRSLEYILHNFIKNNAKDFYENGIVFLDFDKFKEVNIENYTA